LKPSLARRVDLELEPGRVEKKIGIGHHFDFKKKRIDPGDPVTQSKPRTRALDRVGSKNYDFKLIFHSIIKDFILIKFL
jgi:hypothetical protein